VYVVGEVNIKDEYILYVFSISTEVKPSVIIIYIQCIYSISERKGSYVYI